MQKLHGREGGHLRLVCRIRMDLVGSVDVAEIGHRQFVKVERPDGTGKLILQAAFC